MKVANDAATADFRAFLSLMIFSRERAAVLLTLMFSCLCGMFARNLHRRALAVRY